MKSITVILSLTLCLALCGCGGETSQEKNNRHADLTDKWKIAEKRVTEIQTRMRGLSPGGELEIEAAELRDAKERSREAEKAMNGP